MTALKPKVGDMVTLKPMRVVNVHDISFRAEWAGEAPFERFQVTIPVNDMIASIEPRALQVGDRVWITADCKAPSDGYRVEFVSDRVVLSYNGKLLGRTYPPAGLTRVEDKP